MVGGTETFSNLLVTGNAGVNGTFAANAPGSGSLYAIAGELYPGYDNGVALGDSSHRFTIYAGATWLNGALNLSGATITAPSGYATFSGTFTCYSGQRINSFTVSQGLIMGYSCN